MKLPEVIDQAALSEKKKTTSYFRSLNYVILAALDVVSIFWFTLGRIPLLCLNKTVFYFNKISVTNGILCVTGIHISCR